MNSFTAHDVDALLAATRPFAPTRPAPPPEPRAERSTMRSTRLFVTGVLLGFTAGTVLGIVYPQRTMVASVWARAFLAHEARVGLALVRAGTSRLGELRP